MRIEIKDFVSDPKDLRANFEDKFGKDYQYIGVMYNALTKETIYTASKRQRATSDRSSDR